MKLLFLGDIVGKPGRDALTKVLPKLIKEHAPDFVIANVENIAHGAGINIDKLDEMAKIGIDAFTAGDHTYDVRAVEEILDTPHIPIVRPGNWPSDPPGRGWRIVEKDGKRLLLMNALGRSFVRVEANDFFAWIEQALNETSKEKYDASFLDFHAETTSEKRAVAEVFDGKIDVIVGTHTHVQTNDAQTLPNGTGFLTDAGMCGPQDSILGAEKNCIIHRLKSQRPTKRMMPESGPSLVCGCIAHIEKSKTTMELVHLRDIAV